MIRLRIHRIQPHDTPGGWVYEIRDTSRPENHQIRFAVSAANWRSALRKGLADLRTVSEKSGT